MIAEAIKALAELAVKASAPQKIDSGNPREVSYVVGGECLDIDTKPAPRKHEAKSLADVVALANRFAGSENSPVVWYDEDAVTLVIDDQGHRLETATFRLLTSEVFDKLAELARTKPKLDQKAFVRLLRIDLAGTLEPVVLLNAVRAVRWSSVTDANIGKQRESMGRDIEARCSDGKDLPEEVTLRVPVYRVFGERAPLPCRCSVEVDAADGTFRLLPFPDELDRVRQSAVASIADRLRDELGDLPFYYGKP